jgi:hypothetical protein
MERSRRRSIGHDDPFLAHGRTNRIPSMQSDRTRTQAGGPAKRSPRYLPGHVFARETLEASTQTD